MVVSCLPLTCTDHPDYLIGQLHPHDTSPATFTPKQLWGLQKKVLDNYMYPANIKQAESINSNLLAPNVRGRVDVTTNLAGQELNTEYLYGLFATLSENPGDVSLLGVPVSYEIIHFVARDNLAVCASIINFSFTSLGVVMPIELDTWTVFNAQGQIEQYDTTFRRFSELYDTLFKIVMKKLKTESPEEARGWLQTQLATSICNTHERSCQSYKQYANHDECIDFLIDKIRFGQSYELGRNTLLCRMVHQNMIKYRPEEHCKHIGKEGGGMCVDDMDYVQLVTQPFYSGGAFIAL